MRIIYSCLSKGMKLLIFWKDNGAREKFMEIKDKIKIVLRNQKIYTI